MQRALQYSAYAIGLWLNLQVISALMRGIYRQYPFVFAYALTLLASTVIEIALRAAPKTLWDGYYWADEVILDVLVFCVVIAFIDQAARHSKQKLIERHWLVLAAAAICAVSFAIHHRLPMNRQMTLISRDLNICAVILDLILWSLLAAARRPNRRLMLLSGGLGLQLTGAIMGEQLRQFSRSLLLTGTLLEVTTGFLCLYIWWRALRTAPAPERAAA
jgi:hypothetical protein